PAAVEALVHDRRVPAGLGEEVAVEPGVPLVLGVRQVDVGHPAAGQPVHGPAVGVHPRQVPQRPLVGDRHHRHLAAVLMPEPTAGPMSVLAVKYRYLPPLSKATLPASLMPSVTWWVLPDSTEYRKTAFMK